MTTKKYGSSRAQYMKGFCLTEEKLSTELFMLLFFFFSFPLDDAIPISLGSYVLHSTALCNSDIKQDFPVKHQDCIWLSSIKVIWC